MQGSGPSLKVHVNIYIFISPNCSLACRLTNFTVFFKVRTKKMNVISKVKSTCNEVLNFETALSCQL